MSKNIFEDFNEELNNIIKSSRSKSEIFRKLNKVSHHGGFYYRRLESYINKHSIDIRHLVGQGPEILEIVNPEIILRIIKESESVAEVYRRLNSGISNIPYTERVFRKKIKEYIKTNNVDISHFTGHGWSKGKKLGPSSKRIPNEEIFVLNGKYKYCIKDRFLEISKYECYICGIYEWHNKKITLQLDHINGISYDNRLENLRLLCPNCHSQTETFCRSKSKKNKCELGDSNSEPTFSKKASSTNWDKFAKKEKIADSKNLNYCQFCKISKCKNKFCSRKCQRLFLRKVDRPPKEVLMEEIQKNSFLALGRKYGVSDNAVRKWCRYYGLVSKHQLPHSR